METTSTDFATYRAIDAVNWSTLKEMDKSPAHYAHRCKHPLRDTPRLLLGRAVHTAVLEPDEFPTRYVVFDGGTRRGKTWNAFSEANADKSILKADEYRTCLAIRDAVHANTQAAKLLKGESEVTVEWIDEVTGIRCKGRIDHVRGSMFSDLKTTGSVDAWTFAGISSRMLYHAAAAFYARGLGIIDDLRHETTPRIIAVEIKPPHDVAVFAFTDDAMLAGDQKVTELLRQVAYHTEQNGWPGRYDKEQELGVPEWMVDPDEDGWGALNE